MATLGTCRTCGGKVSSEARACPHCGQPNPSLAGLEEAQALARMGQKIEAIKMVRERTGRDLKAAKDLVDSWDA